jgi:SNF family Na+-dependent transporter
MPRLSVKKACPIAVNTLAPVISLKSGLNIGPGLIFQTLPIAFGNMTGGWIFGLLFFILLVFVALSSAISLIEPAVAWCVERYEVERKKACIVMGFLTWLLGLGTVFSFNNWSDVTNNPATGTPGKKFRIRFYIANYVIHCMRRIFN